MCLGMTGRACEIAPLTRHDLVNHLQVLRLLRRHAVLCVSLARYGRRGVWPFLSMHGWI